MGVNLTNHIADGAGLDPERQQLLRRLKADESMLTRVRREKNELQDANTKQENQRLRRSIFSKCLNEL